MEFNAQKCRQIAQHSCNSLMEKKYEWLVEKIKTAANNGDFSITTECLRTECCKWLMEQGFKVLVFKPNSINGNKDWYRVSETYYERDLTNYRKPFGIKISWKL